LSENNIWYSNWFIIYW